MTTLTLRYPYDYANSNNGGDYAHYCKQVEDFIVFWSSSEMSEENTMIGYHRGVPIIVTRHDCYSSPVFEVEGLQNPSVIEDQDGIFIDGVHFTPIEYCESAQFNSPENWARQCAHAAQAFIQTKIQKIQSSALADDWETVRLLGGEIIISPEVSKDWRILCEGYVIDPNRIFRSNKTYEDEDGIFIDGVHFTPIEYCESAQFNTPENWARQCVHAAQALIEQNQIEAKKELYV